MPVTERYPFSRRVLHWLSAAVILWATLSGFTLALVELPPALEDGIGAFNVVATLLFIPFFLLRLGLAVSQKKPASAELTVRQQRLAAAGHQALYITVLLVLLSGVCMMERPLPLFGLMQLPPLLTPSPVTHFFSLLHHYACALLALLVAGHVAAVVMHQRRGVRVMHRML